jgi:subtilisin family serine protease
MLFLPTGASADARLIVRTMSVTTLKYICSLVGCNVTRNIDGATNQLFLVTAPDAFGSLSGVKLMLSIPGVVAVELDQVVKTNGATASGAPPALEDRTPVNYYGSTVWRGYVTQPANGIVGIAATQSTYKTTGTGVIVAVIDTGVDTTHPALANSLVSGYDFTRNGGNGSEMSDVNQSTMAVVDEAEPCYVNQSTMAVVDQSTMAVVDDSKRAAFGHGTMVAGIVHLVAPTAKIMPLKAFNADGSGYSSDILRAIYWADRYGANVINMSFSYPTPSAELSRAITTVTKNGVVVVASAGNDGKQTKVYPAGLENVIAVASTNDNDQISIFSNYGQENVWIGAPGEGIVTTYPFKTYAAGWGTSFSTPFASGTVALLGSVKKPTEAQAASATSEARYVSPDLGNGRLDSMKSMQAWRRTLGIR